MAHRSKNLYSRSAAPFERLVRNPYENPENRIKPSRHNASRRSSLSAFEKPACVVWLLLFKKGSIFHKDIRNCGYLGFFQGH